MSYTISEIFIYPIKSLGGISVKEAEVTDRGFKYDRRWMLVDENCQFLTQRNHPQLALFQVNIQHEKLIVSLKVDPDDKIEIPLEPARFSDELVTAIVWDDSVIVKVYENKINSWFSQKLSVECKLAYMPDNSMRKVDGRYAKNDEITSLSDGYPFLIIGQQSLNLLNSKLDAPVPMNRFRPNLVFNGERAHEEDNWKEFSIGYVTFYGVKLCSRCVVTTIDQDNATKNHEPLKTLSTYRNFNGKIMFGMNLLHKNNGKICVGDKINLKKVI